MFQRLFWLAWFSGALLFADMKNPDSIVKCVFSASVTALIIAVILKAKQVTGQNEDKPVEENKPKRATREDVR